MSRGTPQWTRGPGSRVRGRLVRRLGGLLLAVLALALVLPPAPAWAHAELLSTTPAEGAVLATAPGSLQFVFGEPVFLGPDGFQLYDGSGGHRTVPAEAVDAVVRVTLPPDLGEGSYVLGWRVVSDDSHPESGMLSFSVGRAGAQVPAILEHDAGPVEVLYGVL
jgi:copper transport protein